MRNLNNNLALILLIAIASSTNIHTQDQITTTSSKHSFTIKSQYFQFKDEINYGLVFSGFNLMLGYDCTITTKNRTFIYAPEIGFGPNFNIGTGLAWRFKPVNITYLIKSNNLGLNIGGYLATDYQWQQYSELQGGSLFWFHTLEIGPAMSFSIPISNKKISVTLSNSMAGFASRPTANTEPLYYAFSLSEFVNSAHRNLKFGFSNVFNRSKLGIALKRSTLKRFSVGYEIEFFKYFDNPVLSFINHSLSLTWKIGAL